MWGLLRPILIRFIYPILKPAMRLLIGILAVPLFRFLLRRIIRVQEMDEELEKDLEQWFRGSLVLLASTANMENAMFGWLLGAGEADFNIKEPIVLGMRLLLVIGVIESMPDQELFAIIHPGPPPFKYDKEKGLIRSCLSYIWPATRGMACQHLNRSSPVFAILSAIFIGPAGWICFGMAITQYLIIGLVTSKDRALDALSEFDRQIAIRRRQLVEEFDVHEEHRKRQQAAQAAAASPRAAEGPTDGQPEDNRNGDPTESRIQESSPRIPLDPPSSC